MSIENIGKIAALTISAAVITYAVSIKYLESKSNAKAKKQNVIADINAKVNALHSVESDELAKQASEVLELCAEHLKNNHDAHAKTAIVHIKNVLRNKIVVLLLNRKEMSDADFRAAIISVAKEAEDLAVNQ